MDLTASPPWATSFKNGINIRVLSLTIALCYLLLLPPEVSARGRMMEPAQRSSLWTRGFSSPINNDDTGLNCGGSWVQHGINKGKCGVCGDRYDVMPRANEPGGKYANGIIANTYTTNDSSILVVIDIQSYLGGYFEFRICPHNNPHVSVQQECLNRHQLRVWDVFNKEPKYRYYPQGIGLQRLRVEVPRGMTCTQCVLQWKWHTANDWGQCADGTSRLGCGPQEEYFNCADISIEQAADPSFGDLAAPINFEVGYPPYDSKSIAVDTSISFLPEEALRSGNIGPVLPKFDFYDPSATSEPMQTTTNEIKTKESPVVQTAETKASKNVVELKFNGNKDNTNTIANIVSQTKGVNNAVTYESVGNTDTSETANIAVSGIVTTEMQPSEPTPTQEAIVSSSSQPETIASTSIQSEQTVSTSSQPTKMISTSTQGETTVSEAIPQTSTSVTSNEVQPTEAIKINRGGIAIPTFAISDLSTGGMLVKVGMGATAAQPTIETPVSMSTEQISSVSSGAQSSTSITEAATPTEQAPISTDQSSVSAATKQASGSTEQQTTTVVDQTTTRGQETTTNELPPPIPSLLRATRVDTKIPAEAPLGQLRRRRRRQAKPPPPPPPPATGAEPGVPSAPSNSGPLAEPSQPPTMTFGGLIGDSFSRGATKTQHTFMTQQDFQQSLDVAGGQTNPMVNEALGETSMTSTSGSSSQTSSGSLSVDMQGYPPDMMLAPGPTEMGISSSIQGIGSSQNINQGTILESMYAEPSSVPIGGGIQPLDAPVDASPSAFTNPGIPRPPKQSNAELEMAISGAPVLTSAISDTSLSLNPADIVGASYIPELSEGQSNQAETSTAARHSSMIIPVETGVKRGGTQVEYLADFTRGTSMGETAADTQAEIRSATMSLARFGYQPTAEQVLSGNIGIHHPTENLDTTNLEPVGPSPTDTSSAVPGILSTILGGGQSKVTDASLDPAVKKTREELIRQLGEAMGVIGSGKSTQSSSSSSSSSSMSFTSGSSTSGSNAEQSIVNTNQAIVDPTMSQSVGVFDRGLMLDAGMTDTSQTNQQIIDMTGMNNPNMEMRGMFGNIIDSSSQGSQQTVTNKGSEQDMLATLMDATNQASVQTGTGSVPQGRGRSTQTIIDTGSQMESNMFGTAIDSTVPSQTGVDPSLQHMLDSLTNPSLGRTSEQTVVTTDPQQNMLDTSKKASMQTHTPRTKQGIIDLSVTSSRKSPQTGPQQNTVDVSGSATQSQQTMTDSSSMFDISGSTGGASSSSRQTGTGLDTRQPQSAMDFVDMGMGGMTIEEMMAILNMEQQGTSQSNQGTSQSTTNTMTETSGTSNAELNALFSDLTGSSTGTQNQQLGISDMKPGSSSAQTISQFDLSSLSNTGVSSTNTQMIDKQAYDTLQNNANIVDSSVMPDMQMLDASRTSSGLQTTMSDPLLLGSNSPNVMTYDSIGNNQATVDQRLGNLNLGAIDTMLLETTNAGGPTVQMIDTPSAGTLTSTSSGTSTMDVASSAIDTASTDTTTLDLTLSGIDTASSGTRSIDVTSPTADTSLSFDTTSQTLDTLGISSQNQAITDVGATSLTGPALDSTSSQQIVDSQGQFVDLTPTPAEPFDFSTMTQAEMEQMIQMYGGMEVLQPYLNELGPDPAPADASTASVSTGSTAAADNTSTVVGTTATTSVPQTAVDTTAVDVTGSTRTTNAPVNEGNMDITNIQQFLNPAFFDTSATGASSSQSTTSTSTNMQAESDLNAIMNAINPTGAPLDPNETISLADLLAGRFTLGSASSANTQATSYDTQSSQTSDIAQVSVNNVQGSQAETSQSAASFTPLGQIGTGSEFAWAQESSKPTEQPNYIWDPVQMQWVVSSAAEATSTAVDQTSTSQTATGQSALSLSQTIVDQQQFQQPQDVSMSGQQIVVTSGSETSASDLTQTNASLTSQVDQTLVSPQVDTSVPALPSTVDTSLSSQVDTSQVDTISTQIDISVPTNIDASLPSQIDTLIPSQVVDTSMSSQVDTSLVDTSLSSQVDTSFPSQSTNFAQGTVDTSPLGSQILGNVDTTSTSSSGNDITMFQSSSLFDNTGSTSLGQGTDTQAASATSSVTTENISSNLTVGDTSAFGILETPGATDTSLNVGSFDVTSSRTSQNVVQTDIGTANLSDVIPIGQQTVMTEKAPQSTLNVDRSPTVSTAGSDKVIIDYATTLSPIVKTPPAPTGIPSAREQYLLMEERKKQQELKILLEQQRNEIRRMEQIRREQQEKMALEKQRIAYEKQQLALKRQQMELELLRQEQAAQRKVIQEQQNRLEAERLRIEQQRLKEIELIKQQAIEAERKRILLEQQKQKEIELAKKQAAEAERQRLEAIRKKEAAEAAERERIRVAAEKRRLALAAEHERIRIARVKAEAEARARVLAEAKAKAEARAKAEALARAKAEERARALAEAKAKAEAEAAAKAKAAAEAEAAAAAVANATLTETSVSTETNFSMSSNETSFTPIGSVGGTGADADAATLAAWQAVVRAAQINAGGSAVDTNTLLQQQQQQILNPDWMGMIPGMIPVTPAPTTTPAPATGIGGIDAATLMQLLQLQQQQNKPTTPAPTTPAPTTPKPKRKIPIRPDPKTREFVRNMFIDNMAPGVDPLSILIGLTPEMLMKSGVNPLIANSGDLARIVPAVERALGISLQPIPVRPGPGGRPRAAPQTTGFQPLNIRGQGGPDTPGSSRREFMLQQRMMNEMMGLLGIGPEPLEPGDPGYTGPGAGRTGGRGAVGGPMGSGMGGRGRPLEMTDAQQIALERQMGRGGGGPPYNGAGGGGPYAGGPPYAGGGGFGAGGGGMGGPGGGQGTLTAQMEMLGL